jgi:hypothetical protein
MHHILQKIFGAPKRQNVMTLTTYFELKVWN